ncbi:hybrid non-ribosomal peptide synthetase/type I polyketide synthase [Streptomyces humi]|uniref:hybrid non-ribosomal peptide synthetase/type I polyketide synthase n=1 Tax=Streptomyces humi TaxID=1428620 RepID=UPI0006288DCC|nr:hybrid non-ribosomal peptide synthetase/type I polyketide synthase [Streptomyces humi]
MHPTEDEHVQQAAAAVEDDLNAIWREVLALELIGRDDSFFELGGDSLLATQIVTRIRERTGIALPVRDIFVHPTLRELAEAVRRAAAGPRDETPANQPEPSAAGVAASGSPAPSDAASGNPTVGDPAPDRPSPGRAAPIDPVSVNQEQMWFLHKLSPQDPVYNSSRTIRVRGELDLDLLEEALTQVHARHEILRTTYREERGRPTPVVHPAGPVKIGRVDLSGLPAAEQEAELRRLTGQELTRPFVLSELPLERWTAFTLGPREHELLAVGHHIVHDSWSFSLVLRQLEELYNAGARGGRLEAEVPAPPYRAYARSQRQALESPAMQEHRAYWREQLSGVPGLLGLPTDRPRPSVPSHRGGRVAGEVPAALMPALDAVCRAQGVSSFMVLYACFAGILHRYSGDTDICVGSPLANRRTREEEELVGLVMNTAALRARLSEDTTFEALLRQARETVLDAAAHQACPLPLVIDDLGISRTAAHAPLFQTMITVHDDSVRGPRFGNAESVITEPFNGTSKSDLGLIMAPRVRPHCDDAAADGRPADGIALTWEYNADLFDAATVEGMAAAFLRMLDHALAEPGTPVSRLRLSDDADVRRILREWSAPAAVGDDMPGEVFLPVHRRVELRARTEPGKAALVQGSRSVTYGELDRDAGLLARRLRAVDARAGTVVGICLPPGPDLVMSELAVLKTGAAFLPIDPGHPQARAQAMAEDADVLVVITDDQGRTRFPGLTCLTVHTAEEDDVAVDAAPDTTDVSADDLAYIMFTSGSTGRPKGVEVPHRGLSNLVSWYVREYGLSGDDNATCVFSPGFDATQLEIWPSLAVGATLHFPDRAVLLVAADYQRWMAERSITLTTLPVALATPLLGLPWDPGTTLRLMVTGGERLTARPGPGTPFRLINVYGPTETTVLTTVATVAAEGEAHGEPSIGRPVAGVAAYVLDTGRRPVPAGVVGELHIGGSGVARGYLGRPELTREAFVPDPFSSVPGARMYRTGDLARFRADGEIEFIGRIDEQVKVRGYRIELGEIASVLRSHDLVRDAHVVVRAPRTPASATSSSGSAHHQLVAYVVPQDSGAGPDRDLLRRHAARSLPEYMVPTWFVVVPELPLTLNGKVDTTRLPEPGGQPAAPATRLPADTLERRIADLWCDALELSRVSLEENFFDLGGHSLLLAQVHHRLDAELGISVPLMTLFEFPTVSSLAAHLSGVPSAPPRVEVRDRGERAPAASEQIAVVGMAGRFPGAADIDAFWENLRAGVESITPLGPVGPDGEGLTAFGLLESAAEFDAEFFGYSPRDALLIDPQQRVFLEVVHTALEDAGLVPRADGPPVGIFAGGSMTTYYSVLRAQRARLPFADDWEFRLAAGADHLTTRPAHKLGLSGPAVTVATACSTSLTAVHLAAQALMSGDCDVAVAGGAGIRLPLLPVRYSEGGPFAVEGHVRAFDADASGIVGGSAAAVVVLKRLSDALAAGDHIHAVVRGSAINNDGGAKIGFTAPSIEGQAQVVRAAHLAAGIEPDSVGYVETHGTGTPLGDPIEVAGLTRAFRAGTDKRGFCYLGSVKTNIGHTDAAAGVVGFIKAVLAVERGEIPPSLNFEKPNPQIDFDSSPFVVNTELREWKVPGGTRRAGVTALGIGGTNVHVVIDEPPAVPAPAGRPAVPEVLPLSARSEAALEDLTTATAERLAGAPELSAADVALTLQQGRRAYPHRRFLVARDTSDAAQTFAARTPRRVLTAAAAPKQRPVAFMFPGQGGQHIGMARDLYEHQPEFRRHLDEACEAALGRLGLELRALIHPDTGDADSVAEAERRVNSITVAQPAVFVIEYALARLWRHWGIEPSAVVGHSLGAYAAACAAGVFSLEDGVGLVGMRGRLLQTVQPGAMLAVRRPEEEILPLLPDTVTVAAVNGPGQVTVSGREADIDAFAQVLTDRRMDFRKLRISGAGHSPLVESILEEFHATVAGIRLAEPTVPFVSDMTGTWVEPGQLTDPSYWTAHMRRAVRFGDAVSTLLEEPDRILLEVGPGMTLSTLSRQHPELTEHQLVVQSQPHPTDPSSSLAVALEALGRLWLTGAPVDWDRVRQGRPGRRVKLPGHPLYRRHYLVEPPESEAHLTAGASAATSSVPDAWMGRAPRADDGGSAAGDARHHGTVAPDDEAAAGTPTALRITQTFRELLGLDEVEPSDSLFDLGGDSVLATRLAAWLRDTFHIPLETREVFVHPTVAALAELTDRRIAESDQ